MKTLKQIVSLILLCAFGMSAVFNILFIAGKIDAQLMWTGFVILLAVVFVTSLFGIIVKNIRKDARVAINIITPVGELGVLYVGALVIWTVSYFVVMVFFR